MKSTRKPKVTENQLVAKTIGSNHVSRSNLSLNQETNGAPAEVGDWVPKTVVKPLNQLVLADKQLEEEFTRILNANDPLAPQNIARFGKERCFKTTPYVDHLVTHFEFDGYLNFKTDDPLAAVLENRKSTEDVTKLTQDATTTAEANTSVVDGDGAEELTSPATQAPLASGSMRNQFDYSQRAAQTLNNPSREHTTNTEPPPLRTFSDTVSQWKIFDAYEEDQLNKEKGKEKAKAQAAGAKGTSGDDKPSSLSVDAHPEDVYYKNPDLKKAFVIIERMANQNTFDEISQDFKYYEDQADELGDRKSGTLLPLWKFQVEKDKKKQVTSLCWSPKNTDLFVIGYGSYDFSKQGPGLIACFSLKNPSYPEYIYRTPSGVMSLDFNPDHPSVIAAGLYDGTVLVYNLQVKGDSPIFQSTSTSGKHTDPVWQVSWQKDDLDENLNFLSISSDGRVTQWTMLKNELIFTDVIKLQYNFNGVEIPEDERLFSLEGGCSFDCNKNAPNVFIVGTEEGRIHKCSKDYGSQYLMSYEGHQMAVYNIRYSPFLDNIFLSASADWNVKLWEHDRPEPIMSFDLNSSVGDIAWAPFNSTLFAAATADGKVLVYDLNLNKFEPICEQQVIKKGKLTHIAFNRFEPILLVGDDRGNTISLKLSPNLRRKTNMDDDPADKLTRVLGSALGKSSSL